MSATAASCIHHWRVEAADGRATSPGRCLRCGDVRLWSNRWHGDSEERAGRVTRQEPPPHRERREQAGVVKRLRGVSVGVGSGN